MSMLAVWCSGSGGLYKEHQKDRSYRPSQLITTKPMDRSNLDYLWKRIQVDGGKWMLDATLFFPLVTKNPSAQDGSINQQS